MLTGPILKIFGQFWRKSKNIEYQYRILKNRTFSHKTVQFTGLPFRIQKIAEMLTKNRKKLNKSIKFWQICQKKTIFQQEGS